MNTNSKIMVLITILVAIFFFGAFSINFIVDDFYFLKISRIDSFSDIAAFFSPFRTTFYRPLASEVFYAILTLFNRNIVIGHSIVFAVYLFGIYALYRSIKQISNNTTFACCAALLYALHFTHVFQLYTFNTFQEVLMMSALAWSFWKLIQKKHIASYLFFGAALLSKENAVLFPVILLCAKALRLQRFPLFSWREIGLFGALSGIAFLLYLPGARAVAVTENTYTPTLSLPLIANNAFWYTAWSLGAPNFLPDHMRSIFGPALPSLWAYLTIPFMKWYLAASVLYLISLVIGFMLVIPKKIISVRLGIWLLGFFLLFLFPALPIIHKWMVRLTLPLIPVVLAQAWIITQLAKRYRTAAGVLVVLYLIANFTAIRVHEVTSNYKGQSDISEKVQQYFIQNRERLAPATSYYFIDPEDAAGTAWGWSKQLETTLHGSDFIDHVYPGSPAVVFYGYRKPQIRPETITIPADLFVP